MTSRITDPRQSIDIVIAEEMVQKLYDSINAHHRSVDPNWRGDITVEESVRDQLKLFDSVTLKESGTFVHRNGQDANLFETLH